MRRRDGDPTILAVEELGKAYGPHAVLEDVSFMLPPGTIAVLGGSNGTGKSTLLRCLAGLVPFTGSARVTGVPIDRRGRARRLIGYLPQTVALPDRATVGEVLAFFARLRDADPGSIPVPDGFLPPAERPIGVLSGGQRQRVALAVALLGDPKLLLLDEPVANLDEGGREGFWDTLRALRDEGAAALVASPLPGDLAGVADRAVILDEGRIVLDEPIERLHSVPGEDERHDDERAALRVARPEDEEEVGGS